MCKRDCPHWLPESKRGRVYAHEYEVDCFMYDKIRRAIDGDRFAYGAVYFSTGALQDFSAREGKILRAIYKMSEIVLVATRGTTIMDLLEATPRYAKCLDRCLKKMLKVQMIKLLRRRRLPYIVRLKRTRRLDANLKRLSKHIMKKWHRFWRLCDRVEPAIRKTYSRVDQE